MTSATPQPPKPTLTRRHALLATAMVGVLTGCGSLRTLASAVLPGDSADDFEVRHSDAEWRDRLSPEQYRVLRQAGTEQPFSSPLDAEHRTGTFGCAGCGLELFSSVTKFDSGTGWPSFFQALNGAVLERGDASLGMIRTEVKCHRCGGHLGHVFDDGPQPTGLRYCMNGAALTFTAA